MQAEEIEKYLTELGIELDRRGIKNPIRIMVIGGAYMLLVENAPRPTNDIDIFWLEDDVFRGKFHPVKESVQTITQKYHLRPDWFNYLTQTLMYNEIIIPEGTLWKCFGPLYVYVPPKEYILALKIMAGREKDIDDCAILLAQTKIKTPQQAQQLLDQFILPEAQEKNAERIQNSLEEIFRVKGDVE